jgi:DNA-binding NarL/FixJ family response regulator
MTQPIRIVLADDHPIVLSGLRDVIRAENGFELVGEAVSGPAALDLIRAKAPDLAVLDVSMPGLNGIALTKRLADECPLVAVILLTVHEDRAYVGQALQAGARGYVLKRSLADNLIQAIRAVVLNGTYIDPNIAGQVVGADSSGRGKPGKPFPVPLTPREWEVLRLTALGQTNKEIAQQIQLSVKSVETYKARGTGKIGLRTRADIVRYAVTQGWFADV